MGMKIQIIRLFNGLLAVNIIFVIYLIMHDFESSNYHTTKNSEKALYHSVKPVKSVLLKETDIPAPVLERVHGKMPSNITILKHDSIKKESREVSKTQIEKQDNVSGNKISTLEKEKRKLWNNIELLFPTYMHRNKTNIDNTGLNRIRLQYDFKVKEKRKKIILLYYFDRITTDQRLQQLNCNANQCHFSRKPSDFEIADAVLFKELPRLLKRPAGKPDQIWIYVQLESPLHTKPIPDSTIFNWTATYRLDSVIPTPYEIFQPFELLRNPHERKTKIYKNYAEGKTRLVAWFVSNCMARNNRLEYAHELQKYIPVDIYGYCGTLKCPSSKSEACKNMLKKKYKFYLAFENSNCRGYVTEKFFNALRNDVVPIVMGAHPADYSRLAPPQSYIHVDQFESAENLAKYLQLLDKNDHLYNTYFDWKGSGDFRDTKFQCRLCSMLEIGPLYPVWYDDINEWWRKDTCISANKTWVW